MPFFRTALMVMLALQLGACASLFQPDVSQPLTLTHDAWEHTKPGCTGDDCPLVNIDTVHIADEPKLDALIQTSLLQLTHYAPLPTSLQAYEAQFLSAAAPRTSSYLQAKVREQHDGLVIVELSSYVERGDSHDTPGRGFINWSRQQGRALSLQDMLVPGQEEAFWQVAELAQKSWQVTNKLDQDQAFIERWPFQKTPYVALTYGGVILKYNVETIAPYAMGHIELKLPYPRLNGIIRPELFPGRG